MAGPPLGSLLLLGLFLQGCQVEITGPDIIRNLTITDIKTTSISLNWTQPVGNVAFYTVQWSNASVIQNSSTYDTSMTINDLTPGTQYTFSITAFAADNQTSGAAVNISQYTSPDIIINLTITDIKTTSISLNWTQPVGNVAFYTVQWSNASVIQNSPTYDTSMTINDLTPGTQYTLSITAFAADNQTSGAAVNISHYTRPDIIRNLTITDIKTTSISLNWTQPVGNVAFYTVQWSNASVIQNSSTYDTSMTINDLTPGTQYTFSITAFAADNQTSGAAVNISQYTSPDIIINLTITDIKTTSISLNWTQPVGNVAFYTVQWSNASVIQNSPTYDTSMTINDLTPGTQYTLSITAFAADNQTSGAAVNISHYTRPDIIRNLTITDIKTTSISLNWTQPVGNVAFYTVQWSNASVIQNSSTYDTSMTINDLTPGTQYTFSITAFAADNQTSGAAVNISQYTSPDIIINLTITDIKTTSISLNWTQPVGNVAFYTVQWSNASVIQNSPTYDTSMTINDLTPGTQYTLSITAFAADNQTSGAAVNISHYTRPDIIRNLTITDIKTTSISLNWTQPVGNVAFYTVQWSNASVIQNSSTYDTSMTINDLTPGTQYTFSITAFAADNQTSGAAVNISHYTRPDIIRNLTITDIKTTSISLNWTQPVGNVAFYTVQWSNASVIQNSSTYDTSMTINDLTPGTQYTFSITAFAADNQTSGAAVNISQYTSPDIIINLTITDIKTTSISLNWTQPVGNVAFYTVQWSNASVIQNSPTYDTSMTINDLTPGTQYTLSITAFAADNQTSGAAVNISHYTRPDIIRNLTITDIKTTSISLNWTQPVGNVAFYTVQWSNASVIQNSSTYDTSMTINDLTPGTQYAFSVVAVAADNQTFGAAVNISQYTSPDIIRNLTITNIKTTSISLNWTQPVGNVAFYTVQWSNANVIQYSSTYDTSMTINDLTPGTQYAFSVVAVAADNQTSGAAVVISQYTRPDIIRNLTITNIKTTSISLNWTQPVGNVAFYTVQWSNASVIQNSSTYDTSMTINDLTPGTQYAFSIVAVASDNHTSGAAVNISHYTRPDIIRNLTITDIKTTSISLNWTQPVGNVAFYTVQWSNASVIQNSSTYDTSMTMNDLTPGTQYTFSITVFAADNQTFGAAVNISQYTSPDIIRNLTITNIKTTSISLNWTQPVGNVAFYTVQWSNANVIQYSSTYDTSMTINDLMPGTQYAFSVVAVAADNQTSGAAVVISQYTRPDIIRNLTITNIKTTSISLNWTQPVGNVAFYTVQWSNASVIQNSSTYDTSMTINDLTPGTQYAFSIVAVASDNHTSGAAVNISHYTRPDIIRNLTITDIKTTSISLNWTQPVGNVAFYTVQWSNASVIQNSSTYDTSMTMNDLTPGTQYTFSITVFAADNQTFGAAVNISQYTSPDIIRNLTITNIKTTSISLNWTQPVGNVAFYTVQWSNASVIQNSSTYDTSMTINDLTPGTQYAFSIVAVASDNHTSGAAVNISHYTRPDIIRNLTITDIKTTSISLNWTQPVGNVAFYTVQWSNASVIQNSSTYDTSMTMNDLTPGTQYTFSITVFAADNQTFGAAVNISQYTSPDIIRNLTITNIKTTSISLNWTQPVGNVAFYTVQWSNANVIQYSSTYDTSMTINDLMPGTQYAFSVVAVAADNQTSGAAVVISQYTRPDIIRNLTITNIKTTSISLNWTQPVGNVAFYTVQWSNASVIQNSSTYDTSMTINDLTPGTQYAFSIVAVASDNHTSGAAVNISHYTRPDIIRNLTITDIKTTSISLNWTQPVGNVAFYTVQWSNASVIQNSSTYDTSMTMNDLTPGTQYTFSITVFAADNQTFGAAVNISQYTSPDIIRNLTITNIKTTSISLNWTQPVGNVAFYTVQWSNANVIQYSSTYDTSMTINDLMPGTQYAFSVVAVAADNQTSGAAVVISQYTRPDIIRNLTITNIKTTSISLNWTQPVGNVAFYTVQWSNASVIQNSSTYDTSMTINDLTPGTQYAFSIVAVASDNHTSGAAVNISHYTRPDIIRNLTITDIKTTSISLNWTQPVGNVAFYTVQWSNASVIQNSSTYDTSMTMNDLTPGTQYTFSITVFAADNQTFGAAVNISQYTSPDIIRNLTITNIKTTSISLNWTQPVGNVAFYTVQWSNANVIQYSSTYDTSMTINDLMPGTQYAFSVVAVAADNQTSGAAVVISQYTRPDIIRNLTITNIKTTSISLNWTQPVGNVAFYTVQWSNASVIQNSSTYDTSMTINDLTPGTQYAFSIVAVASDNHTSGAAVNISHYTRPDIIRNLTITDIKTTSISLNWTQPVGNVAFYTVQWSNASVIQNSSTYDTSMTMNDLTPGTQYTFSITVFAADNQTFGAAVNISQYTSPDIIRNLTITNIKTTSISLNWTQPVGNVAFYTVQWSNANVIQYSSTYDTSMTINDLTPGTQYAFSVVAVAADNQTSGAAVVISQYTRPDIIRNLTITNIKTTSISLNWTQPVGNVAFYTVQWSNANVIQYSSTYDTSMTINDLTPGTQYAFSVVAVAADNQTSGAAVVISQYTRPDIIRNLTITNIKTTSISLNWTQPVGNVAFYTVQWSNASVIQNSSTYDTSMTINDLTPGTQYAFSIVAVASDNHTSGAAVNISHYTRPDIIRNLTITDIKTTSISLNWTQPVGNVAFYTVQWSNANVIQYSSTYDTSMTINDLTPGTQYAFSVVAVAADNQTSGAAVVISQYTRPDIIINLTITDIKTTSISLNWTQPVGNVAFYTVQWSNASVIQNSPTYNTSMTINDLTPGTQYTLSITAFAADNQTSGAAVNISHYTRPDIISNLIITDIKTTSISLNWTQPVGNVAFYTVQWSNASVIQNSSTYDTSMTINDLTPGTQYTLSITAFAADNQTSGAAVNISQYTRPYSAVNLTSTSINTSNVSLAWIQQDAKDNYSYLVQVLKGTLLVNNLTVNTTSATIPGLESGSSFTFSVTTQAADGTRSAPASISESTEKSVQSLGKWYCSTSVLTADGMVGLGVQLTACTDAAPPLNFSCSGPNGTSAQLILTWNMPSGSNQGFTISLLNVTEQSVNCCQHTVSNLSYYSNYTVIIWTLGPGKNSTKENRTCTTGITKPPTPDIKYASVTQHGYQTFVLELNPSIFNDTYGPVTTYGVLMALEGFSGNVSDDLVKTYNNWKENEATPYLAVVRNRTEVTTKSLSDVTSITIGDKSEWEQYYNGPLTPKATYSFAVVLFTQIQVQNSLINPAMSLFTVSTQIQVELNENPAVIGGIVGGILAVLIILIAIVAIFWRRRTKNSLTEIPIQAMRAKVSIPVRVEDYETYFKKQRADSNCGFAEEFEDLKTVGLAQSKTSALAPENKAKNRYNNVLPYDFSRVKLSVRGNPCDDYINANYIPGYSSRKEFIATQGPLPGTLNDFWRMIWEKNIHTLVMLTRCNEQGRVKCEKYWPSDSKHFDNITVTNTDDINLDDWTIRDFRVKNVKTAETRFIRQFHFTAWPDHGVPETTELLINFRYLVREHMDQYHNSPTVVHCSAGVGRTGTFIAIDRLIYQIEQDGVVDVFGTIHNMRMHRSLMVQTEDQYVFLNQCVLDIIRSRNGTNVDLIYQNTAALAIYENIKPMKDSIKNSL